VQAPNPDQQLRPGTTAQIAITAQTVKDALVVPAAALLNAKGDAAQVMVVDSQNQASSRDVKTGISTGQQVQIVSGLKPGEIVVTEGAYGLPDKTKVKIEKPETESAGEDAKDKDKDKDDDAKSGDSDKGDAKAGSGKSGKDKSSAGNGEKPKAGKANGNKDKSEKD
jgi:multidrug efflux system membrane fusion protein